MPWIRQVMQALVVFSLGSGPGRAETTDQEKIWMTEAAIRAELVDRKLAGEYPSGVAWAEEINGDGTSDYAEGSIRSRGRWTLSQSLFCFRYEAPLAGGCFRMIKLGANCYELYVERDFALPLPAPRDRSVAWNGRMWRTTEKATCEEKPSV